MSYNTRRQSGQGMGVGRGAAQVLYHQQQRSGGPGRMQQTPPTTPQHGYSSQQQIQTVSSGYNTQPSTPAYTTQPQQQQQQSTPSTPQGYSTQQYQTQPPPPQPQPQPQPKQPVTPAQQPPIKAEPITPQTPTPAVAPPMEVESDSATEAGGEGMPKPKSWQLKKKMPGFKVNKKVKKRRQNARLRKILQPKNAIMVLNELKTGIKFTFQEHTNALTQTMFVVNAEVDGKVHTGQGLSKPLAKQNAAENALKALLLEKMAQAAIKAETTSNDAPEPMQEDTNNGTSQPEGMNTEVSQDGSEISTKPEAPEDDVPWGSLASFALYKLFTDWQSQGTHVPIPKQAAVPAKQVPRPSAGQPGADGTQNAPAPMKKIPDNPTDRHPVMLLNQMRPGIQFTEVSREGTPPNLTFTLSVTVDGKSYTGVAKNKKDAKKEAAKAALAGSLSIFYD